MAKVTKAMLEDRLAEVEGKLSDAEHALAGSPSTKTAAQAKPAKPQLPHEERAERYRKRFHADALKREPKKAATEIELLRAEVADLKEGLKGKKASK